MSDNPETFIDKQIAFNKDIVEATEGLLKGLNRQAKLNTALAEQLRDQDNTIKTHRQLITALLVGIIGTAIGTILVAIS